MRYTIDFDCTDKLFETPYSRGTAGEGLRLESALPGAPRTADFNEITKAEPLFP